MSNFRTIDRQTGFLLPPSVDEWLPEKHLARFVMEVIDGLNLSAMSSRPGVGVRHHQIGARIPSIFDAWTRKSARRVEPRDHGLEYEADVRPQLRLTGARADWRSSRRQTQGR
jgi:hypothetical protein